MTRIVAFPDERYKIHIKDPHEGHFPSGRPAWQFNVEGTSDDDFLMGDGICLPATSRLDNIAYNLRMRLYNFVSSTALDNNWQLVETELTRAYEEYEQT